MVGDAVQFRACYGRCSYNDGFIIQDVPAGLADGFRKMQVVGIERFQIIRYGNVAETESSLYIVYYNVDGHSVIFIEFAVLGQHVELLNLGCGTADAPAQSKVLVSVTMGMGDLVHSWKAMALLVLLGSISCFIASVLIPSAKLIKWHRGTVPLCQNEYLCGRFYDGT